MAVADLMDTCATTCVDPERVARIRAQMTDARTTAYLAETFAVLGDSTRLRIVEALAHEETCVCDLSAALGLSQSCTSHHLRTLRNLRIVRHRREGRLVYYALDDDHVRRLFAQGLEHAVESR